MDRFVSFALFISLFSWTANCFEVMNTQSPLETRTGCKVVLTCGGFGTRIEWRRFGDIAELESNENQTTSKHTINNENMSFPYVISNATLVASPAINNERFNCFIFGTPDGRTITHQVQLRVEAPVAIRPSIEGPIDISFHRTDTDITIGCPVQTCAEEVTVQFFKEDQAIRPPIETLTRQPSVYNLVLKVSEDVTGTYACKVDTTNPTAFTMMKFNVTGTPLPPLTTTPPPSDTPPSIEDMDSDSTEDTTSPDNKGAAVMATLTLPAAALLLSVNLAWL